MRTLEHIQKLPERQREQILWTIVGGTFVVLMLLWVATSQIPKASSSPKSIVTIIREKIHPTGANASLSK